MAKFGQIWPHCYRLAWGQCDQIGRFFALWAIIQSRWQQFFYPNCPHCQEIFVKVPHSFIFLVKSFLGNFYRHLAIFIWSHCLGRTILVRTEIASASKRSKKMPFHRFCVKRQSRECAFHLFLVPEFADKVVQAETFGN